MDDIMEKYCYYRMNKTEDNHICNICGQPVNPESKPHQLKPGTILMGKYLIGHAIGEGGFGITYISRDLNLDILVAV